MESERKAKQKGERIVISLSVGADTNEMLTVVAKNMNKSKSAVIDEAVRLYVNQMEMYMNTVKAFGSGKVLAGDSDAD